MAIRIEDEYTNATPADAAYPGGSFKNETAPGNLDGTPLEKAWANDLLGFRDALMAAAGIPYSEVPDTAAASDALLALEALFVKITDAVATATADKVMRRDANGRSKAAAGVASDDLAVVSQVAARALLGGSSGQVFSVAPATAAAHAIRLDQMAGAAIGYAVTEFTTTPTVSAVIPYDDTIPTSSEGTLLVSAPSYTNKFSGSKLVVEATIHVSANLGGPTSVLALFNQSESAARAVSALYCPTASTIRTHVLRYEVTTVDVRSWSFNLRLGSAGSGTFTVNGVGGSRLFGGVLKSSLRVIEIKQ